jgi:hypothetical protein
MAGCGDDAGTAVEADDVPVGADDTSVEPGDLAGTWTATSMVFTQTAAPMTSVDVVARDGAVLTLVLTAASTYTLTFVYPPDPTENLNEMGIYTTTSTTITITPTGGTAETSAISRDGDTMTATQPDDGFDFGSGGEPATLVTTLTR